VALFDLPSSTGLDDTVRAIAEKGRRALKLTGDVRDTDALAAAVKKTEDSLGALSLAVNSAGIANARPAEEMPLEQWKHVLDVNLTGVFVSCQPRAGRCSRTDAGDRQYRLDVGFDRQPRSDSGPLQFVERASFI